MTIATALFALPLSSFLVTLLVLHVMLKKEFGLFADVPNVRSLHERVVPRGGGIGFVSTILAVWLIAQVALFHESAWVWYIFPFAGMAMVGWLDDRCQLGILTRLATQFVAAGAAISLLPGPNFGGMLHPVVLMFAVVMIVWVTNLYNFMDGMDGLAGSQAVLVYATMATWLGTRGALELSMFCLLVSAAVAAFLVFNWTPARVFMGDSGSLALGIGIGVVALGGYALYDLPPAAFFVLMGVFLFDATYTLLRRMLNRERWWQSHRHHLYQRAHALGMSQSRIVAVIIGLDLVLAVFASAIVYADVAEWIPVAAALMLVAVPAIWISRQESRSRSGSFTQ